MEQCALTSRRDRIFFFILASMIGHFAWAESEQSSKSDNARENLREMLERNEAKWRDAYRHELTIPILSPLLASSVLFPDEFSSLHLGMTENELRKVRPTVEENIAGPSLIRDVYDFVPGRLTERNIEGAWRNIIYHVRRRRLAIAMFTTEATKQRDGLDEAGRKTCTYLFAHLAKPTTIKATENIWGVLNRTMLIWQNDNLFAILSFMKHDNDRQSLTLLIGAQSFFEEQMKLYNFATLPLEAIESLARESFPYLKEVWQESNVLNRNSLGL